MSVSVVAVTDVRVMKVLVTEVTVALVRVMNVLVTDVGMSPVGVVDVSVTDVTVPVVLDAYLVCCVCLTGWNMSEWNHVCTSCI